MLRSLFSGVSGMRSHQVQMDVIADNIANVNTTGYKAGRVTFKEVYSQLIRGARAPEANRGGINPFQVGLGVSVNSIDTLLAQGAPQSTGRDTDLAINGKGFFVLSDGQREFYTRAGNFSVDSAGQLVYVNGMRVMGWNADANGSIDPSRALQAIVVPADLTLPARATSSVTLAGNLSASQMASLSFPDMVLSGVDAAGNPVASHRIRFELTPTGNFNEWSWKAIDTFNNTVLADRTLATDKDGEVISVSDITPFQVTVGTTTWDISPPNVGANPPEFIATGGPTSPTSPGVFRKADTQRQTLDLFDSLGNPRTLTLDLNRTANSTWEWQLKDEAGADLGAPGTLTFDTTGKLVSGSPSNPITVPGRGGAANLTLTLDFAQLTQLAGQSSTSFVQDGYTAGRLLHFTIDDGGTLTGVFSNDRTRSLARIAVATFRNPEGLIREADTLFTVSGNSGPADPKPAGTDDRGRLAPQFLEMSNVDLSQEFTNLITAQRGFQANSRVITTSDEMLQELMTLKR